MRWKGQPIKKLIPIAALVVSLLNGIFLIITIFFYSDPAGADVSHLTYSILAAVSILIGTMTIILAAKALRSKMPLRGLSIAALCCGILGTVSALGFAFFGLWFLPWITDSIFE